MSPKIIVLSFVFLMTLAACEDPVATPIACGEGTELNAAGDSCTISEASLTKSFEEGVASVDITTDNQAEYDAGMAAGVTSVDITTDNDAVADEAFAEGVASVDITTDNQAEYDAGMAAGVASVDITTDNQAEYDAGMAAGVASVDITTDNQAEYDAGMAAGVASVTCEPSTLVWTFEPGTTIADETFTLQTNGIEGQSATMRITATLPESYTGPGDISFSAVMLNGELIDLSTATVALTNVESGLDFNGGAPGSAYLQLDGALADEAAGPAIAFIYVPLTLIDGVNTLSGGFNGWMDVWGEARTLEISLY